MRLRNFSRFDLFSSFHMRVNCWFLKSSTIDSTAPRLGGNTVGVRDGQSVLPVAEDNRSEENLVHKPFLVADSEFSMSRRRSRRHRPSRFGIRSAEISREDPSAGLSEDPK